MSKTSEKLQKRHILCMIKSLSVLRENVVGDLETYSNNEELLNEKNIIDESMKYLKGVLKKDKEILKFEVESRFNVGVM